MFLFQLNNDTICDQTVRQQNNECRTVDRNLTHFKLVINLRFIPTKPLPGQVFEKVFDELEDVVKDLLFRFGCVVESKADIVVRGQVSVDNITWYQTW